MVITASSNYRSITNLNLCLKKLSFAGHSNGLIGTFECLLKKFGLNWNYTNCQAKYARNLRNFVKFNRLSQWKIQWNFSYSFRRSHFLSIGWRRFFSRIWWRTCVFVWDIYSIGLIIIRILYIYIYVYVLL